MAQNNRDDQKRTDQQDETSTGNKSEHSNRKGSEGSDEMDLNLDDVEERI
jgi:hypothetical protein